MLTPMKNRQTRTVTTILVAFLRKTRSRNSNKIVATMLQLGQEQIVSDYCARVMNDFEISVLPSRPGFDAVSKSNLIKYQTSRMSKKLFDYDDQLMLICDGTYACHQKSKNKECLQKSFSGQSKVSLYKPFTVCTTTRYLLDMLIFYHANENDA